MTANDRLTLAWSADAARLAGQPGAAEDLERELSAAMLADYQRWADRAEKVGKRGGK